MQRNVPNRKARDIIVGKENVGGRKWNLLLLVLNIILLSNSVLEAAEISTVSISKVINVETDTREDEYKITGLGLWTQKSYTIFFIYLPAQNVSRQILYN